MSKYKELALSRKKRFGILAFLSVFLLCMSGIAAGGGVRIPGISGSSAVLRVKAERALVGKKIAFVPVALGSPLMGTWDYVLHKEAVEFGMKYEVRDPNWSSQAELQAVSALIAEHPDVLIVHNPNLTLLTKLIKKAEEAGIWVLQINMISNQKSTALVGGDIYGLGFRQVATIAEHFKGKRTPENPVKFCLIQGEQTAPWTVEMFEAVVAHLKRFPYIKLVATQACNWDPKMEHDYMATVLEQHPDLDAVMSMWDVSGRGAAHAIREAGKEDQVVFVTSGGGAQDACEAVREGLFDYYINYHAYLQGHDLMTVARFLLQSPLKPGQIQIALYSPTTITTKENVDYECTPYPPTPSMLRELKAKYPRLPPKYLKVPLEEIR